MQRDISTAYFHTPVVAIVRFGPSGKHGRKVNVVCAVHMTSLWCGTRGARCGYSSRFLSQIPTSGASHRRPENARKYIPLACQ